MHGIRRPSSQNGRRTAKRLGDEYQNVLILVAQDSSLKATAIIAVGGNQALALTTDAFLKHLTMFSRNNKICFFFRTKYRQL